MGESQPSPRSPVPSVSLAWIWRKEVFNPESSSCSLPPSLTTGPTSPHECGDAGPPLGREPVASGALRGPAWRPSPEPRWETRGARRPSGRSCKARVALRSRVAGSRTGVGVGGARRSLGALLQERRSTARSPGSDLPRGPPLSLPNS